MKYYLIFLTLFLTTGCSTLIKKDSLEAILADEWQQRLDADPVFATSFDASIKATQLSDSSLETLTNRAEANKRLLQRLNALNYPALDNEAQIHYRIFKQLLENQISQFDFSAYQIPFNADSGFFSNFARLYTQVPFHDEQDYLNYLEILKSWPRYVGQQITHMEKGLQRGMTQPQEVIGHIPATIRSFIVDPIQDSNFYKPFHKFPISISKEQQKKLRTKAIEVINSVVNPGYLKLADFMEKQYIPAARKSLGASDLPDGQAYYAQRIKHFTTLDLSVDAIHQIGLDEVKRIRSEMQQIINDLEFEGSFEDFIKFLRTDPRFYATSAEELLKEAAWIAKKMDAKLPSLFKHLPRLPYGVQAVPASIAPNYTTGRYVSAHTKGTRPGYYWVNTHALDKRPLYVLESLTLHEAVPGHHLQIALNNELKDLPLFRQYSYINVFGEGWGLYAEWLGIEAGFYQDPYSEFGRLSYEMWRAVRLVVDTGIHARGWTRQQARDYLASNTALSLHNVHTEIDRYITWPGQALAYKIGEIKIKQLRQKAEEQLGASFDVREFHHAVLGNGSVPLDVLEDQVMQYIDENLQK